MAEDELYDDLETRAFYEQLPDLRAELPAVLFGEDPDEANAPDKKGGAPAPAGSADVDALLKTLPQLSDKAAVDKLAADIVGRGGKSQRRAIVRALAAPPARRPELLPRYARLASILANCFKAVGTELLALLQEELEQLRNKMHKRGDAPDAPAALYLTAYLAEFVKFQLLGAGPVFSLLKTLLDSFSHGHVCILCALLEGCGKFLYARTESRQRCETMLSLLVKLRSAHRMPYELSALIDNAVYSTKPPDTSAVVVDDRPHVVRYIEFLLHRHLSKLTLEHCVRQLRKLPWQQPEIEAEARAIPPATHPLRPRRCPPLPAPRSPGALEPSPPTARIPSLPTLPSLPSLPTLTTLPLPRSTHAAGDHCAHRLRLGQVPHNPARRMPRLSPLPIPRACDAARRRRRHRAGALPRRPQRLSRGPAAGVRDEVCWRGARAPSRRATRAPAPLLSAPPRRPPRSDRALPVRVGTPALGLGRRARYPGRAPPTPPDLIATPSPPHRAASSRCLTTPASPRRVRPRRCALAGSCTTTSSWTRVWCSACCP